MFTKDTKNLSIATLVTVIIWILYEMYLIFFSNTVPTIYEELTRPVNPDIDVGLINELKKEVYYK